MAKVTGPLLSIGARGTIGKTATFGQWRGIAYARQRVVPNNPRTANQQQTRGVFSWASDVWKLGPPELAEANNAAAEGRPVTGRNIFIGANTKALRTATDLTDFVASTGARGAPTPVGVTAAATATTGELQVTVTLPAAPNGWTLEAAQAVVIRDQDPHNPFTGDIKGATETANPTSFTVTGLTSGTLYRVAVWLRYARPDGRKAYSASVNASGTPL